MAETVKTDDMKSLAQTRNRVLQMMCQKFKGQDAEIDLKIDAAASFIMSNEHARFVPGLRKGEPTVPPYLEGEAGVGKTAVMETASRDFCKITGLNFVKNPPTEYIPTKKDFYFFDVSLAAETNKSEFGGLPIKSLLTGDGLPESARSCLVNLEHDANLLAGLLKVKINKVVKFGDSSTSATEMIISGEDPRRIDQIIGLLADSISSSAKDSGINFELAQDGGVHKSDRVSCSIAQNGNGTTTVKFSEPTEYLRKIYVAGKLPDIRFEKAHHAKFCFAFFDEVDKTYPALRNALLQLAQQNRVPGMVDLGDSSFVAMAGNSGVHNASESVRSVPEVSRMEVIKVHITPSEWAEYMMQKYGGFPDADCCIAGFMDRAARGNPHLFHADLGKIRGNAPSLPNPRSWENAMSGVALYFESARMSGQSPLIFKDQIRGVMTDRVGRECADSYMAHLTSMLTEAIPLADAFIQNGKLSEIEKKKFNKNSGDGSFRSSAEQDFGYRFATAIADSAIKQIDEHKRTESDSNKVNKFISDISTNAFGALATVDPSMMTYGTARISVRASNLDGLGRLDPASGVRMVNADVAIAFSVGIAEAIKNGLYGDQNQSDATSDILVKYFSGESSKPTQRKPRPPN